MSIQDALIDDCQQYCEEHGMTAAEFTNQAFIFYLAQTIDDQAADEAAPNKTEAHNA